ncbi:DUF983 domain-containing protein [Xanthovirga aplysinae]|uniref:DUF983 domain-containing protein n=1 Tax=Xanthovirga aplysinae TaxID=2529853 RepID=UPI0012BC5C9F|nr:DUF983 domain-containing protein [Xanthovirga aplysinae]MTI31346.1 DUF983 domain-containing protein [Xanthovirga aplysinae]
MSRVLNIIKEKCPKCEKGEIFQNKGNILLLKYPRMRKQCPHCSHTFEIEPGFFTGAMYVSYALIILEMVTIFFISLFLVENVMNILWGFTIGIILLSFTNYRYSRVIWMYLFTNKEGT